MDQALTEEDRERERLLGRLAQLVAEGDQGGAEAIRAELELLSHTASPAEAEK